jgi:hypothetical protein
LSELLDSVQGFKEFRQQKLAERQRERERRLTVISSEAEKGVFFVDEYLRKNLGDKRTQQLLKQKERLGDSLKSHSIDEITSANDAFQKYLVDNSLSDDYREITRDFTKPTSPPTNKGPQSLEDALGTTERSRFAITGPEDDIVIIYNASPSAPSVAKDIIGKFVFLTNSASLCFAHASPDESHIWFVERLMREQGAVDIKRQLQPCDVATVAASIDFIVFKRSELRKQRREYILGLVNLIESDTFRKYRIVTAEEYTNDIQNRHALSLTIAQEVGSPPTGGLRNTDCD